MHGLKPGKYIDFGRLENLINRERCKPPREEKGECWNKGFNHCCDLISHEIRAMVSVACEPPIMPGDAVESLESIGIMSQQGSVVLEEKTAYIVHAITKDMLSFKGIEGWWPTTNFRKLGLIAQEANPVKAEVRASIQPNQAAFEVVRDIATTIVNMQRGASVTLKIHAQEEADYFDWQSSTDQQCGSARVAQAMREAYFAERNVPRSFTPEADEQREALAMLRGLKAQHVPDSFIQEVVTMGRRELMKRAVRLSDWVHAYHKCLDGLGLKFPKPLEPRYIREIVEQLQAKRKNLLEAIKEHAIYLDGNRQLAPEQFIDGVLTGMQWVRNCIEQQKIVEFVRRPAAGYQVSGPETGLGLIAEERKRQVTKEGWSAAHDDEHEDGELALAAASYALTPEHRRHRMEPAMWPFDTDWWKPTPNDRVRELAKAGALIAAEIDRLNRLAKEQERNKRDNLDADWIEPVVVEEPARKGGKGSCHHYATGHGQIVVHPLEAERVAFQKHYAPGIEDRDQPRQGPSIFDAPIRVGSELERVKGEAQLRIQSVALDVKKPGDPLANYYVLKDGRVSEFVKPGQVYYCPREYNDGLKVYLHISTGKYVNKELFRQATREEVLPQFKLDETGKPATSKDLNIDSGTDQFELARSLHRVVRAMHDGHCPSCGYLGPSPEFEHHRQFGEERLIDHVCPQCNFTVTADEADEALAMFRPYMQKNHLNFVKWQASRK